MSEPDYSSQVELINALVECRLLHVPGKWDVPTVPPAIKRVWPGHVFSLMGGSAPRHPIRETVKEMQQAHGIKPGILLLSADYQVQLQECIAHRPDPGSYTEADYQKYILGEHGIFVYIVGMPPNILLLGGNNKGTMQVFPSMTSLLAMFTLYPIAKFVPDLDNTF